MKGRKTLKAGAHIASLVVIAAALSVSPARAHDDHYHEYADAPYGGAYDDLRGYGSWRYVPSVGARLWFPYVETSWRPYYYGHWIHTNAGMTWVSYEPWGEVPHHYGRWVHVDHHGWGWVPGWEYSPAWVSWGVVDGYVGWVPCAPAGYRYPRHHRYHAGFWGRPYGWGGSFGYHTAGFDFSLWVFVPDDDFYGAPVHRHAVPAHRSQSLVKWKNVRSAGPRLSVDYVEKVSKRKIETVATVRKTKRVGDRSIQLYEPRGQGEKIRSGREIVKRSTKKARESIKRSGVEKRLIASADPAPVKKKERKVSSKSAKRRDRSATVEPRREKGDEKKNEKTSKKKSEKKSEQKSKRKSAQKPSSRTRR